MYSLRLSEEASKELEDSALWYEQQAEELGLMFLKVIEKKLALIQQFPQRYPVRKSNFREATLRKFPFLIVYKFYKRKKEIVVFSIFHTKQNPKRKYLKRK